MIYLICEKYGIENYTVNDDESIDVNGSVDLSFNDLTELPLVFNKVTGDFYCSHNVLTSLKGSPKWVGGYFDCYNNQLTSLEFSPEYVGTNFYCYNNDLTDNYCESEIGGKFYTSLKQEGLTEDNYNEWRKLYKRKMILDDIFNM
jgi:hypothetical protein